MRRVLSIAANTYREAIRDRVLYNLILFAFLLIGAAILFGTISVGVESVIMVTLGLSSISVFGLMMAVFIGIGLVSKEIERKTIYNILSKPVARYEFILGKFLGLMATLIVNTSIMAVGFFLALYYVNRRWYAQDLLALEAIYFILLQLAVVTALTLFFSLHHHTAVVCSVYLFRIRHRPFLERRQVVRRGNGHRMGRKTDNRPLLYPSQFFEFQCHHLCCALAGDSRASVVGQLPLCFVVYYCSAFRLCSNF